MRDVWTWTWTGRAARAAARWARGLLAGLLLLPAAEPLAAQLPDSLDIEVLGEGLWALDGAVDRIGVLAGEDGVLLVDVGYMETEALVRDALDRLGLDAPTEVLDTHWHHAFGNAAFAPDARRVIAHETVAGRLSRVKWMYDREVPPAPPEALPDRSFADSLTLSRNGRTIRLLHYPRAHTEGDVVVWLEEDRVLFAGDLGVPHVPWIDLENGGDAYGWLAALDDLVAWLPRDATVVPGHGPLMTREELAALGDLFRETIARVERARSEGRSHASIVDGGIPERWRSWVGPIPASEFVADVAQSVLRREARGRVPADGTCRYVGGLWWTGDVFEARTVTVSAGRITAVEEPGGATGRRSTDAAGGGAGRGGGDPAACSVDLGGLRVVPAYGDAHRHDLADPASLEAQMASYLERGVFYAMEQDPTRVVAPEIEARLAQEPSVDVAYARGVVTPSWGMIASMYRGMVAQGVFGDRTLDDVDGREVFLVDDEDDLERHWPALARQNDRFIKVILAFSEDFDRRSSPEFVADPPGPAATAGLDPALLPELVRRAHAAGLRVSAHIETRADFRVAVEAGADVIAHLPASWQYGPATGYDPADGDAPWLLTADDARAAAEADVVVVTTIQRGALEPRGDRVEEIHRHNLERLREHGVRIAVGSDGFVPTILAPGEAIYLHRLGVASAAELLEMLSGVTPRAIFPDRRIGAFEPGYEASFLVLEGDPTEDPGFLRRITLAVKEGRVLGAERDRARPPARSPDSAYRPVR